MLFRMIRGVLFHQKGKMLLIALTIALGASLATGMLNVVLGVEEKVNKELKNYGANIVVKPKDSSLLSDIYDVGEGAELNTAYLREDELGKLKTIFWAFNIVDFTPFLDTRVQVPGGDTVRLTGSWFNHHLDLPTGESLDAGIVGMRSWWDVTEGRWLDEKDENASEEVMAGAVLAERQGWHAGDVIRLQGNHGEKDVTIAGIYDAGGDEDEELYATLDLVQALTDRENKVASIEVSALTIALGASLATGMLNVVLGESEGTILDKTRLLMILITALSLVGSALGISNLVTASVMERSQEIGLLKAIGAKDRSITGVVMTEILITALLGFAAGYLMGFGFAQLIGQSVFGSAIDMDPKVAPIVAGLIALVTIAGSLPAIRMVLRLRPAEVLHGGH